jgi:hypothetical protein
MVTVNVKLVILLKMILKFLLFVVPVLKLVSSAKTQFIVSPATLPQVFLIQKEFADVLKAFIIIIQNLVSIVPKIALDVIPKATAHYAITKILSSKTIPAFVRKDTGKIQVQKKKPACPAQI